MHPTDDWSCGLWCARRVERSLRGLRGEAARPPSDFRAATRRANDFIERLKGARGPASGEAKAKAKAKAKATAQVERVQIEPTFGALDEALEAAWACTKCLPTKNMTNGCRACMGEWFEEIRQRGAPPARDIN